MAGHETNKDLESYPVLRMVSTKAKVVVQLVCWFAVGLVLAVVAIALISSSPAIIASQVKKVLTSKTCKLYSAS